MLSLTTPKIFNVNLWLYITLRRHSTINSHKSSYQIRQRFLDYFIKENKHTFIKSSPIVPYCDSTVPFVNAGMNQFKGLFLGTRDTIYTNVANSQKCARVGGKHNDLNIIGRDGYHHTFFEMLGNWSFGGYFKKEACELAWNLLTGPFALEPSRLYVTYFGGDKALNLEPDLQCRDIWRTIGIANDHIIPFGIFDNFWEMGPTGPCGPCTEIHIDHSEEAHNFNRCHHVNKGYNDLTELWNIVFIQYNRISSGAVIPLSKCHVDTGMGFERLVAVLQKRKCNYDTDVFLPLIVAAHKYSKGGIPPYKGTFDADKQAELDTAYRILVDHSRLITVCLADGMIPDQNPKLRRILRKALILCEKYFNTNYALLKVLSTIVSDNLGLIYPEITKNLNRVHHLISHEEEVLKALRLGASKEWQNILKSRPELMDLDIIEFPGLALGYKEIKNLLKTPVSELPCEIAYKLCDTYGFEEDVIAKLSEAERITFNKKAFDDYVYMKKMQSKQSSSKHTVKEIYDLVSTLQQTVNPTDDNYKYIYHYDNGYKFLSLTTKIEAIIVDNQIVNDVTNLVECSLILNKSSLYCESGGQECDRGRIALSDDVYFDICSVDNITGFLFHNGRFVCSNNGRNEINVKVGDEVKLELDAKHRLNNMRNHTCTHLLNAAVAKVAGECVTAQASSKVCNDYLSLGVSVYGMKLDLEKLKEIENAIRYLIKNGAQVSTNVVDSQQLLDLESVTLLPGEVYPENGIRLLEIETGGICSKEACCGTHVLDVKHLEEFCITKVQNISRATTVIHAVTGEAAIKALNESNAFKDRVEKIKNLLLKEKRSDLLADTTKLKSEMNSTTMSHVIRMECMDILEQLIKTSKQAEHQHLRDFIDVEMREVMNSVTSNNANFLVHNLVCSALMTNIKLDKVTRYCKEKPVIIFSYSNGSVKARCCVPRTAVTKNFNAQKWLEVAAQIFNSEVAPPKGQEPIYICNMKSKRIVEPEWYDLLEKAMFMATKYAQVYHEKKAVD